MKDILLWHNNARVNPSSLVAELQAMLPKFGGTDDKVYSNGGVNIVTNEGKVAVNEAITFL